MGKEKLELRLSFYIIIAFILSFLGYTALLFFLVGFVLLVEKDKWKLRQLMQTFSLCIVISIIKNILVLVDSINGIPWIAHIWTVFLVIGYSLVLATIGIMKISKGKDTDIPIFSEFVDWVFCSVFKQKKVEAIIENVKDDVKDNRNEKSKLNIEKEKEVE